MSVEKEHYKYQTKQYTTKVSFYYSVYTWEKGDEVNFYLEMEDDPLDPDPRLFIQGCEVYFSRKEAIEFAIGILRTIASADEKPGKESSK